MRYGYLMALLGAAQVALGLSGWPWGILLVWSGASFLAVGAAYLGWQGPRLFGKRPDGALPVLPCLALLPYLALTWTVWELQRRFSREPVHCEVAPGVWLGRRPLPGEIPAECGIVVDLTCEFPELRAAVANRGYRCLPSLDAAAPEAGAFAALLREVAEAREPVYVHCALGHGRSAMFTAALLTARGAAASVEDAEARLQVCRPGVRLTKEQRLQAQRAVSAARPRQGFRSEMQ